MSERCQNVKKMSNCQKDVKCKKVKHMDHGRGLQKKINWHNEVHRYWCQFWCQIWRSPKLVKNTFYAHFEGFWWPSCDVKIDVNIFDPHYVNFFVNLLDSPCIWLFDNWHLLTIWHFFDNLISFWQFDTLLKPPQFVTVWRSQWSQGVHVT